ncbi:copper chaperone PCu(A)C [Fodinicurvata halophila]|uniref:Copper chaperone PCu(A)C n=1 Tax=Fodinicurvata halophila TaxID=1419723 RepID=A0ABV8UN70_9PROT
MNCKRLLAAATLALSACFVPLSVMATDIEVSDPWARASVGTSRPGVAYMEIRNHGEAEAVLEGLETPVAAMPELHESVIADGQAQMRPVEQISIAPGETVTLAPGGLHVMLMKLQQPLEEGQAFEVTLQFQDGTSQDVRVPILSIGASGPDGGE